MAFLGIDYEQYGVALLLAGFFLSVFLRIKDSQKAKELLKGRLLLMVVLAAAVCAWIFFFCFPLFPLLAIFGLPVILIFLDRTFGRELLPVINERTLTVYTVLFWAVYLSSDVVKAIISFIVSGIVLYVISPLVILSGQKFTATPELLFLIGGGTLLLVSMAFILLSFREHWFSGLSGALAIAWFLFILFSLSLSQLASFMGEARSLPSDMFGFVEWSVWPLSIGAVLSTFFLFGWLLLIGVVRADIFTGRYSNDQFRPLQLLFIMLAVAGSILANHYMNLISGYLLINLWVIFEPYLFKPYMLWGAKIE